VTSRAVDLGLAGRRVVVTGSTRGLGLAFARDLAGHGARVVINGVNAERCDAVAAELRGDGHEVVGVAGSVADEEVVDRLIDTALERFGGVDAVVNNAGIARDARIGRQTLEGFDEVIAVHLRGTWMMIRKAVQTIGEGGLSVVNLTSGSGLYGLTGQSNYAAAKGGIDALTRALTVELHDRGCRLNVVYPRAKTDMTAGVEAAPAVAAHLGDPEAVAPLVSFLASPASGHVRGQLIGFDGRELTVWAHPSEGAVARREQGWDVAAIQRQLGDAAVLEPLNADPIGRATWEAFGGYPGAAG
jgi:3-oxoacyl-[acyl-carrier protein] reductase